MVLKVRVLVEGILRVLTSGGEFRSSGLPRRLVGHRNQQKTDEDGSFRRSLDTAVDRSRTVQARGVLCGGHIGGPSSDANDRLKLPKRRGKEEDG